MKDQIKNMIAAIESGNTMESEKFFNQVVSGKVAGVLEGMKAEVGQSMFKSVVPAAVEQANDSSNGSFE